MMLAVKWVASPTGEVAERLNALVLKTAARVPYGRFAWRWTPTGCAG